MDYPHHPHHISGVPRDAVSRKTKPWIFIIHSACIAWHACALLGMVASPCDLLHVAGPCDLLHLLIIPMKVHYSNSMSIHGTGKYGGVDRLQGRGKPAHNRTCSLALKSMCLRERSVHLCIVTSRATTRALALLQASVFTTAVAVARWRWPTSASRSESLHCLCSDGASPTACTTALTLALTQSCEGEG